MEGSPEQDGKDEATWVSSGSFRVDRRKALSKLSQYRLADPQRFLLSFARAASALGAGRIELGRVPGGVSLSFDGRGLSRAELRDPYRPIFEGGSPAQRHLAVGLLAAFQAGASRIEVRSGAGGERLSLTASSVLREELSPAGDAGSSTSIEVARRDEGRNAEALGLAARCCGMCRAEVLVEGRQAVRLPGLEPELEIAEDGLRALIRVPGELHPSHAPLSLVEPHVLGVRVDKEVRIRLRTPVHAIVDDDRLRLDASLAGVVEDERWRRCLHALKHRSPELIPLAAKALRERLPVAWRALADEPGLRPAWSARLREPTSPGAERPGWSLLSSLKAFFFKAPERPSALPPGPFDWEARALRWFRLLCARELTDPKKDSRSWILSALWSAPLYFACSGRGLSLAELADLAGAEGGLAYCAGADPRRVREAERDKTLWVLSGKELGALGSRFTLTGV